MARGMVLCVMAFGGISCATAANRAALAENQLLAEQEVVCEDYEMPTGSHIAESVCRDSKEVDKRRQNTQQMVKELARLRPPQSASVAPNGH